MAKTGSASKYFLVSVFSFLACRELIESKLPSGFKRYHQVSEQTPSVWK